MSLNARDIRPSMDVFSRDGAYLGTVLRVAPDRAALADGKDGREPNLGAAPQSSAINGELLGPMPTAPLGNPGPLAQSARGRYAAEADGAPSLRGGSFVVGRWWGLLGRRVIPLDLVMNVSLERVILEPTYAELVARNAAASSSASAPDDLG
ncbi:MAG: hypothetical protein M3O34_06685 [Chloroflexota bacterium]|nr:hypothetical protein [Chloroflexota bacterium]